MERAGIILGISNCLEGKKKENMDKNDQIVLGKMDKITECLGMDGHID